MQIVHYEVSHSLIRHSVDDHIPGMVGFDYKFLNGDHHIAQIIVGSYTYNNEGVRGEDAYLMSYSDKDSGVFGNEGHDPCDLKGYYWNLRRLEPSFGPFIAQTLRGRVSGVATLDLNVSDVGPDDLVFLRGFEIKAPSGRGNHHLRAIGVRYVREEQVFRITFNDNSPRDDEFFGAVHYFVVPHYRKSGTDLPLFFSGPFSRELEFKKEITISKDANQGVTLLSGFHFEFQKDDRHIERIAIDLRDIKKIHAGFSAHNPDRSVKAVIDYVELSGYEE